MNGGESFRLKRRDFWARSFGSGELCLAGLVMGAFFLLNPSTFSRVLQFLFFWFLAWSSGKKNNPLITLTVMLGIVLFNLTAPYGRVLVEWGALKITAGSLEGGIRRAVTLEGLLMLSAAVVRGDLRLPGPLGSLLAETFRLLEKLRGRQGPPRGGDLILWLDELLLELSAGEDSAAPPRKSPQRPRTGRVLLAAAALITAALGALRPM